MNLLTTIRGLFQHMEWADALVWQTVAASDAALEDEDLRARLLHLFPQWMLHPQPQAWMERKSRRDVG
jgi:hypothetical protein